MTECCDKIAIPTTSVKNREMKVNVNVQGGTVVQLGGQPHFQYSMYGRHPCGITQWNISAVKYKDLTDNGQSSPITGTTSPAPQAGSGIAPNLPWNNIKPDKVCIPEGSGDTFYIPLQLLPKNVLIKIFFVATDCCDGNTGQDEVSVTLVP